MKYNLLHLTVFIFILTTTASAQEQGFFLNQWTPEKMASPSYTDVKQTTDSVTTSGEKLYTYSQPSIINVIPNETSIGKYQKIELTVDLTANYTNPYDYSQVNLKGVFIAPGGKKDTVDGFYYQDFTVYNNAPGNMNTGINGSPEWKIRFTPTEIGNWQYKVYCIDKDGTSNTITQNFTCTSSASKGFIRKTNGNYMKYDDGTQYFPIGANYCWWMNNPLGDYQTWLESLSANNGNFIRIFMAYWSFGIEWNASWNITGLGNYANRQENAFLLDWVIEYSRQKQIFIELCLNYSEWAASSYNSLNGGPCKNQWDFFTNTTAKMYYKNYLRYIIARWGFSPNIFSWEEFNEVDCTENYEAHAGEVSQWHNEMAIYMKNKDVNKHLISTSFALSINDSAIWKLPAIDYTQTHYYTPDPEIESIINFGAKNYLNEYSKPTKNGEFGLYFDDQKILATKDPSGIYVHNVAWNTALSGAFGIGMSWWWDGYIHPHQIYKHFKVLSDYVSSIDLLSNKFISKNFVCQSDSITTFSVIPIDNSWKKSPSNAFTVTLQGELIPDNNKLSKYLFGNELRNPPTFHVNYIKNGVFKVKVANGGTSQTIEISLDGNPVLTQSAISNSTYSINVPAGEHSILVNTKGTGGIEISEYTLENYVPVIKSTALVSSNKAFGWVHNRKYNWKNVYEKGIPDSVRNAKIIVTGLDDGVYSTDWMNCQTGKVFSTKTGTSLDGEMKITCPDFLWDCAYKITQVITGSACVSQGQNSVVYTIPAIPNAISYIWTLPPGATGTSTTNSITVNYGISAVSGNISVKGHTNYGEGVAITYAISVNPLPASAGIITGTTSVCSGQNSVSYTVPTIANATSYVWTLPTGATGLSNTNTIVVNYGSKATSGIISVKGKNECLEGAASTLAITVNPVPTSAGIITGSTTVCKGAKSVTFAVPAIANATSYIWTLPEGVTGLSITNSITVNFSATAVSGNISVKGHNECGDGTSSTLAITVNPLPNDAEIITGSSTVCRGQKLVTYTVPAIANATSYIWTLPNGVTGSSLTNSINLNFGASAKSGNITVRGHNSCGDGVNSALAITVNAIPVSAETITGLDNVCKGQNSVNYTVPAITYATSYIWTLPNGTIDTSFTNSINLNFSSSAVSGNISVKGHNECGDGTSSTLAITVNNTPKTPILGTITQPTCSAATGSVVLSGLQAGSWTINPGAITGSTASITIPNLAAGTYKFAVTNSVGCVSSVTANVVINAQPVTPVRPVISLNANGLHSDALAGNQWYEKTGMIVGATAQDYTPTSKGDYYVVTSANGCYSSPSNSIQFIPTGMKYKELAKLIKVYPNPVTNELIIEFKGNSNKIDFEILNSISQVVFTGILIEKTVVQTNSFTPGIYLIRLKSGDTFEFKKVIKN